MDTLYQLLEWNPVQVGSTFHLWSICFPVLFICLPGWVLVVGFQAGLSPTSFHLSPNSFHLSPRVGGSRLACLPLPFICLPVLFICLPGWLLVVGFLAGLSPTSFHVSATFSHLSSNSSHLSLRLGACGRVPGWLVCNLLSFVSQFFSFVSQAGCLWSGSWLACLPLPFICLPLLFICLPGWVLVVGFLAGLSPTSFHLSPSSFHLSPRVGACGRVPGWLVSHFLSFVPILFICLPGWVLVVGFPAGLSPTSFHLSPSSFHLFPRLVACGRVPGWLVSHFLSCVPHFFSFVFQFLSFVSQAGCLRSGSRLACLQLAFICLPVLFICLPGGVLVVGFPAGLSHLSPTSFHLSPRLVACGRVPG